MPIPDNFKIAIFYNPQYQKKKKKNRKRSFMFCFFVNAFSCVEAYACFLVSG